MQNLSEAPQEAITDHEKKRIEHRRSLLEKEAEPTMQEHVLGRIAKPSTEDVKAPIVNRWDATPVESNDVADDEWDD